MLKPAFVFDAEKHEYRYGSLPLPSVTQVLPDIDFKAGSDVIERARLRGQRVHEATAAWDHGTLDIDSLESEIVPYVTAWADFLSDTGAEVLELELRKFHDKYMFAGTLDRVLRWNGKIALADIKATAAIEPHAALQTAAYAEICGHKVHKRFTVQLKPDGTYRVQEWKEPTDFPIFLAHLSCFNWRRKHT